MLVDSYARAWEREYCCRGNLWGGGVKGLPELSAGSEVLELGCGNGKTLAAMLSRPCRITALDISAKAVRLSRLALEDKCALLVADACSLPFKNESFDAVFAFHVVGHMLISERKRLAMEASRVLKEDGQLFFRGFEKGDMRACAGVGPEPDTFVRGQGIATHYFSEQEVAALFSLLMPLSLRTSRWRMRINGEYRIRSEVKGVFKKTITQGQESRNAPG